MCVHAVVGQGGVGSLKLLVEGFDGIAGANSEEGMLQECTPCVLPQFEALQQREVAHIVEAAIVFKLVEKDVEKSLVSPMAPR